MSLTDHLTELRNRLGKALIALAIASAVCFYFEPHIFNFLKEPYCRLPAKHRAPTSTGNCQLYFFGITDAFFLRFKISMISGAALSAPVWLYQLWSFITPGLHRHERRWALSFVVSSIVLFAAGGFFAYLTLEKGLSLLLGFGGNGLVSVLDGTRYLSYVIAMLMIFGLSFELPLLVLMLNLAGVVTTTKLRSWRRMEIFLVFVFAAVITPSQDPFTLCALAVPMCVFYEVAIIAGRVNDKRKTRRERASPYTDLDDDETSDLGHADDYPGAGDAAPASVGAGPEQPARPAGDLPTYADTT
jgi:sec-independent protein translocase protein TatC